MKPNKNLLQNGLKQLLKTGVLAMLLLTLSLGLSGAFWEGNNTQVARKSQLAQGDAITDPVAILRYALPIDNPTLRQIQGDIEDISPQVRRQRWTQVKTDVKDAAFLISFKGDKIRETIPEERLPQAEPIIEEIKTELEQLQEATETKDKETIASVQEKLLTQITTLEELMVTGFPFTVPTEYSYLPQLLGRATVAMETSKGTLTIVVDGYSAPVNGGNFVDLVQRGFYDGLEFIRSEDYFVLQTGDPPGEAEGFIDPQTKKYRAIPLEVLVEGNSEPIYGITLEDAGLYLAKPVLPFNAYGAVALARPGIDPNGGSSQFFFFKFDTEVTPPGFNVMDGRYSVFGYVVEGKEVLEQLTQDDKIISAKVVAGLDNLVQSSSKVQPATTSTVDITTDE